MNLEDLAKKAIDEVSFEIEKKQNGTLSEPVKAEQESAPAVEEAAQKAAQEPEERVQESQDEPEIYASDAAWPEEPLPSEPAKGQGEEIFLANLKERILVLFEGLNAAKDGDLEQRLELTITFLEFLLAKLEDKLKK